jgi:hypothetical protein
LSGSCTGIGGASFRSSEEADPRDGPRRPAADDAAPDTIRLESAAGSQSRFHNPNRLMRSTVANLAYPTLRDLRVLKGNSVDVNHLRPNASLNSSSVTPICSQKWTPSGALSDAPKVAIHQEHPGLKRM